MTSPYLTRPLRTQEQVEHDGFRYLIRNGKVESWLRTRQQPGMVSHKISLMDGRYIAFTTLDGKRPSSLLMRQGTSFADVTDRDLIHEAWKRVGGYSAEGR